MVRKPCPAVFRSQELDDFLKVYNSKFRRWIEDMQAVLKENMFAGESISKKQIPTHYIERYGVNNLFRYAHPEDIDLVTQSSVKRKLVYPRTF